MVEVLKMKVGESWEVKGFNPCNKGYRRKLLAMGLTRGTQFSVARVAPLGDPVEIQLRGFSLTLRKAEAAALNAVRC